MTPYLVNMKATCGQRNERGSQTTGLTAQNIANALRLQPAFSQHPSMQSGISNQTVVHDILSFGQYDYLKSYVIGLALVIIMFFLSYFQCTIQSL